tara:strand:- start:210 stop:875 length:666 start_codon:yes stop_codon:yes gene_type:complete
MIQHRIATAIKKIETINDSINFYQIAKKEQEESLDNLIASYLQECTSEDDKESVCSLIRYLYWYTDITASKISEMTAIDNRILSKKAGPLILSAKCQRCGTTYAREKKSRTDQGSPICPNCIHADALDSHKAFLEDWIDNSWATHKNPRMDQGTYSAYLHSAHWKKTRSEALMRAGYKCQACSTKEEILDVHHNSYDRLGAEEPQDLIVLCRTCHGRVHQK